MKLAEVLSTILQYEWDGDPKYLEDVGEAHFEIGDKEYVVLFVFFEGDDELPDRWDIEFGLYPAKNDTSGMTRYNITNTGDQYAIMGTIQAICKEWFQYHPINCITMSADVPSRKKLYTRMIHNLLPTWKVNISGNAIIAMAPH